MNNVVELCAMDLGDNAREHFCIHKTKVTGILSTESQHPTEGCHIHRIQQYR